jgi:hypothetical protein
LLDDKEDNLIIIIMEKCVSAIEIDGGTLSTAVATVA